jgi:hypothetical protein
MACSALLFLDLEFVSTAAGPFDPVDLCGGLRFAVVVSDVGIAFPFRPFIGFPTVLGSLLRGVSKGLDFFAMSDLACDDKASWFSVGKLAAILLRWFGSLRFRVIGGILRGEKSLCNAVREIVITSHTTDASTNALL